MRWTLTWRTLKRNQSNLKKPLDKKYQMWYYNYREKHLDWCWEHTYQVQGITDSLVNLRQALLGKGFKSLEWTHSKFCKSCTVLNFNLNAFQKKIKKVLTNSQEYVIINIEMRERNSEKVRSQVDRVRRRPPKTSDRTVSLLCGIEMWTWAPLAEVKSGDADKEISLFNLLLKKVLTNGNKSAILNI